MRLPAVVPRSRLLAAAALSAYAMLVCSTCGATPSSRPAARDSTTTRAFTAVGGAPAATAPTAPTAAEGPASCAETVAATLGEIAQRIYREAGSGGNVEQAVHRLQSSTSLRAAASAGDARATAAALRSLLAGQIARVQVLRGGRVLASAGSGTAIAPVTGSLPGTGGARFVLSVQSDRTYLQVTKQVTGAEVLLLSGTRRLAGTIAAPSGTTIPASGSLKVGPREFQVASVGGAAYPSGALRIVLLVPAGEIPACPSGIAQTRAAVLGRVGERIYEEEAHSPYVAATVRHMEADGAFRAAVAARDPAATRRAIIGFFAAHIHVVRVRVTVGGKLLYDLGGPHVLAPVAGTLRQGGRVIGRFLMAIQDDAGYLKLAHLFTGGQVLMRTGATQVAGTLSPGPASVPDRGTVSYRGRSYQAYSFTGTAFPSGALRISLLF
ncbi:MAG TPA: hypothetical protein VN618_15095 [Solirubrobacteraceae bacterium]|nr:hypothetical protein [Solirubrobacteraceae bacterium]